MADNVVIEVKHLTKAYKIFSRPVDRVKEAFHPFKRRYSHDFYALHDISFEVRRGENIGFIGRNGAGKSTLLKLITGVLTPSSGTIDVHGTVASLLELGAGFNPEMTGRENIYLNGSLMGHTREQMDNRMDDIIAFADIGEFIDQTVKMYSSGMFARLAFAVNAFVEPDILIVDEALSVGDNNFQMKCMKKMRELMEGGTAVLFVSHDINAVRRFCGRAFWLDHGEVKGQGETNAVADQYMQFLKLQEVPVEGAQVSMVGQADTRKGQLAEISSVRFVDQMDQERADIPFDQPIIVEVVYEVYEECIAQPVLGIALKAIDDTYICGLNTLLDEKSIPWKRGRNMMRLRYSFGLRVLGGRYYIDVALFEETATIPMHYLAHASEITVSAAYRGEGEFILSHEWEQDNLLPREGVS